MSYFIHKIISGGQTGADRAGLEAGKQFGIPTGGYIVKNYMTEKGPDETLKDFNLIEMDSYKYLWRTIKNIESSDGTIIFCKFNQNGSYGDGTDLTIRKCKAKRKPYIINPGQEEFIEWLKKNKIKVLNIAGNRESTNPGIFNKSYNFLLEAFSKLFETYFDLDLYLKIPRCIEQVKNNNINGASYILEQILRIVKLYIKANTKLSDTELVKFIYIYLYDTMKAHFFSPLFYHFFNDLFENFRKPNNQDVNISGYLSNYQTIWQKNELNLFKNFLKRVNFKNKNILLHSYSNTILNFFVLNDNLLKQCEIYQTESRPNCEGLEQAKILSRLGYKVNLITDSAVSVVADKIDFALLGADIITPKYFVNKTGSYGIALLMKEYNKKIYLLADERKKQKDLKSFVIKPYPSYEISILELKNLEILSYYFEKIPMKYITELK